MRQKLIRDYSLCRTYFGDYVLETEEVSEPDSRRYVEIQPFIKGQPLTCSLLQEPKIRAQFKEIVDIYETMQRKEHATIDLVGHTGFFRGKLENVFVSEDNTLRIIDATIFESASIGFIGVLFQPVFSIIVLLQNRMLKTLMK